MKTAYLFLLAVLFSACAFNHENTETSHYEARIDSIFHELYSDNEPGAAIAVVQNGKIVFKKGYGSANLEYDIPVSSESIFHIASISKQFTVFSILLLQSEGKLDFDDDIRKYIPELPDFGETITLRQLASHTSGLRDQWNILAMAGWRMDDVITKEHVLKMLARQKDLNFSPGEEFMYCNTGFTLLAEVVARVSGITFAKFTKEMIFDPLKMSNTQFYDDHERIVRNRAYSYEALDSSFKKKILNFANVGATSLFTTVEDLSLWAINFDTQMIGHPTIFDQMNAEATLNNGQTFGGAYGQFINDYKRLRKIEHSGADAGYRSYFGRFPNEKFSIIVFSNLANSDPEGIAMKVSDLYLRDNIIESQSAAKATTPISLKPEEMEKFCGYYWNKKDMFTSFIQLKNDTLQEYDDKLTPISENIFEFISNTSHIQLRFEVDNSYKTMIGIENQRDTLRFTSYEPRSYSTDELKVFTGKFYSEELNTDYELKIIDNQLVATHTRLDDIRLEPIMADMFSGNSWFMSNFKFERNMENSITGILVSNGRVRDLYFKKTK